MTASTKRPAKGYPRTPDGHYFIVRGRLWRCTDPRLPEADRERLVVELMAARRAKRTALDAGDGAAIAEAKRRIELAKTDLGERGPVWWSDGTADLTRHLVRTTRYAEWFAGLSSSD